MDCTLVMFKSDGTRKDLPLVGPRNVIGRMSTCEVRIPLNSVSREHCELLCDGKTLRFKDLNSSNGIVHNGAKSKQGTLKAGDELVIGPVVFTVMIDGKPAKITPVRTILSETDDKRAAADAKSDSRSGSKAGTAVDHAIQPPPARAVAPVAVPVPPVPSREIGSSGEHVEALNAEGHFEEFNAPSRRPAIPKMPAPIGDDDEDVPDAVEIAPAKPAAKQDAPAGEGSGDFEFVDEAHGEDEEEAAFTFE